MKCKPEFAKGGFLPEEQTIQDDLVTYCCDDYCRH
jgi:hypothetical protein